MAFYVADGQAGSRINLAVSLQKECNRSLEEIHFLNFGYREESQRGINEYECWDGWFGKGWNGGPMDDWDGWLGEGCNGKLGFFGWMARGELESTTWGWLGWKPGGELGWMTRGGLE